MVPPNHRFAGICYNNIANLQFKNGKYSVAQENYERAIQKAEICAMEVYQRAKSSENLDEADAEKSYYVNDEFQQYKVTHAHRCYQLAICNYKRMRYAG